MAEVLPQAIQPATIEGAQALDRPRPPHVRRKRSTVASVGLHATLVVATFCALFPIAWVLLSSIKPASEIRRSEIHLFASPTLENYRPCWATPTSPTGSSTRSSSRPSRWCSASPCPPPPAMP